MAKYSESIMSRCRQRRGLEEDDISHNSEIETWSAGKLFRECLEWEGVIGYDILIRNWIEEIYGVKLVEED